ncbi:MAG: hypothetical protein WCL02_02750 [bacterium]
MFTSFHTVGTQNDKKSLFPRFIGGNGSPPGGNGHTGGFGNNDTLSNIKSVS